MARKSVRSRKGARAARKGRGEYHHALLGLVAVIVFLFIGIAAQFNVRATGFVAASSSTADFSIMHSYAGYVYDCQPAQDNYNPYQPGYVVHSNGVTSRDSCIDQSTLTEYSCDSMGRLKADIGTCRFGCVADGLYGYCR